MNSTQVIFGSAFNEFTFLRLYQILEVLQFLLRKKRLKWLEKN